MFAEAQANGPVWIGPGPNIDKTIHPGDEITLENKSHDVIVQVCTCKDGEHFTGIISSFDPPALNVGKYKRGDPITFTARQILVVHRKMTDSHHGA